MYHRPALSDRGIRGVRTAYAALWLAAEVLFFFAATRPTPSNAAVYVTLPQAFSLAGLVWLFWTLFNYVTSGLSMTLGEYRYATAVKKAGLFSAVCLGVTAAATLAHLILQGTGSILCLLCFLLAALASGAISLIESRLRYESFLSKAQVPEEASQIGI